MGGPAVSHLKLWCLEKAALETIDSQPSPGLAQCSSAPPTEASESRRGRDGLEVVTLEEAMSTFEAFGGSGFKSLGAEIQVGKAGDMQLQHQTEMLTQQLLKLKQRQEDTEEAAHERAPLLSPPAGTPQDGHIDPISWDCGRRRMSKESSPQPAARFVPTSTDPFQRTYGGGVSGDKGLACALDMVPNRQLLGLGDADAIPPYAGALAPILHGPTQHMYSLAVYRLCVQLTRSCRFSFIRSATLDRRGHHAVRAGHQFSNAGTGCRSAGFGGSTQSSASEMRAIGIWSSRCAASEYREVGPGRCRVDMAHEDR
eukprot:s3541_g16.t1